MVVREAAMIMVRKHRKGVAADSVEVTTLRRVFLACAGNFNPSIR